MCMQKSDFAFSIFAAGTLVLPTAASATRSISQQHVDAVVLTPANHYLPTAYRAIPPFFFFLRKQVNKHLTSASLFPV